VRFRRRAVRTLGAGQAKGRVGGDANEHFIGPESRHLLATPVFRALLDTIDGTHLVTEVEHAPTAVAVAVLDARASLHPRGLGAARQVNLSVHGRKVQEVAIRAAAIGRGDAYLAAAVRNCDLIIERGIHRVGRA